MQKKTSTFSIFLSFTVWGLIFFGYEKKRTKREEGEGMSGLKGKPEEVSERSKGGEPVATAVRLSSVLIFMDFSGWKCGLSLKDP